MSRLTIDISDQQYKSLKALAALQGKTIKQYALDRLFPEGAENDPVPQELRSLLEHRITEGLAGNISAKSVREILAEEMPVNSDR